MHILMTADTIGGVWTYTRELVTQLSRKGNKITLVSFGEIPSPAQSEWLDSLPEVSYYPTGFRLEWMQDAESDLRESSSVLKSIIDEVKPDLLHFNQFYYGNLECHQPRVVVAHSDVFSWWVSVHGAEPPENQWIRDYRRYVATGLSKADLVVAPSAWMLDQLGRYYNEARKKAVVHNGRQPDLFTADIAKQDYAISVGRIWDAGKQSSFLLRDDLPIVTVLVGTEQSPEGAVASAQSTRRFPKLLMKGPQPESELRKLLAAAGIYIATSRYEPFGLAPLEAALSGCAIVANDIPTFREVWGDTAVYFERNNSRAMLLTIQELASNPTRRADCGIRALEHARKQYSSERMAEDYLQLYRALVSTEAAAA